MPVLFLLLLLVLSGCDIGCIPAGSGVSENSINLRVPLYIENSTPDDVASYWIDSREEIKSEEKLEMSVNGAINFCPKDTANPKSVIVPAVFCQNEPHDYTIDDPDPSVVCKDYGGVSKLGRYVDSGVVVNPGNSISFSLIPSIMTVNGCTSEALRKQKVWFDPDGTYFKDKECKQGVSSESVCSSGGGFYLSVRGKCIGIEENGASKPISFEPINGKTFYVTVDGRVNPYGNVARIRPYNLISDAWVRSSDVSVDLRRNLPAENFDDDGYPKIDCNDIEGMKKIRPAYDINCSCGAICSDTVNEGCVSSMVYKTQSGQCSIKSSDWEMAGGFVDSWAGSLIAKIGSSDTAWSSSGVQCIPQKSSSTCISFSNRIPDSSVLLNRGYKVDDNVPFGSSVLLGISDSEQDYYDNFGGYHVQVKKSCVSVEGEKLYMYIGDNKPTMLPGEAGSFPVHKKDGAIYIINEDNPAKSGRIYFGIASKEADPAQFEGIESEVMEQNSYIVNLFRPKWIPNFSHLFVSLRDILFQALYGTPLGKSFDSITEALKDSPGDGVVHQMYNNYATSQRFISIVRALCTMYIMFTALGYVLGLMQLSKADLVVRVAKMAFIVTIFSPNSWEFFSEHFFALFVQGVDDLMVAFSGYLDADSSFAFLDPTIGVLLSGDTWLRFLALFFAGPLGWLIFFLVIWGTVVFFACIAEAMLKYLMIIIAVSFLISLSPLFFTFILFNKTRSLFDGWLKMLVNFSLQPIILFSCLAFLNQVMQSTLYQMTSYDACSKCSLEVKIYPEDEGGVCLFSTLLPAGFTNDLSMADRIREEESGKNVGMLGLPMSFVSIIIYILLANAMKQFNQISETMAQSISGSIGRVSFAVHSASQALLSTVGLDDQTQARIEQSKGQSLRKELESKIRAVNSGSPGDSRKSLDTADEDKDPKSGDELGSARATLPSGSETIGPAGGQRSSGSDDTISAAGSAVAGRTNAPRDEISAAGENVTRQGFDLIEAAGLRSSQEGGEGSSTAGLGGLTYGPSLSADEDRIGAAGAEGVNSPRGELGIADLRSPTAGAEDNLTSRGTIGSAGLSDAPVSPTDISRDRGEDMLFQGGDLDLSKTVDISGGEGAIREDVSESGGSDAVSNRKSGVADNDSDERVQRTLPDGSESGTDNDK